MKTKVVYRQAGAGTVMDVHPDYEGVIARLRAALERIADESQGLRLRYKHHDLGEIVPPLIADIAKSALNSPST